MSPFLLTPGALYDLLAALFTGAVLLAVLRLPEKTTAARWLGAVAGLVCASSALTFFLSTLHPQHLAALADALGAANVLWLIPGWLGSGMWVAVGQFAYTFLGDPFPRERRAHPGVVAGLFTVAYGLRWYLSVRGSVELAGAVELTLGPLALASAAWAALVLSRKRRLSARAGAEGPARAFRAFTWLLGGVGVVYLLTFSSLLVVPTLYGLSLALLMTEYLFLLFGLVVLFLIHAPERASFQAKLIGLSLVTTLDVLTVAVALLDARATPPMAGVPGPRALRFTPAPGGGYVVRPTPADLGGPPGERLALTDESSEAVALPFAFPFGGRAWDSLHVSSNGAVYFGRAPAATGGVWYPTRLFYDTHPKIAPLLTDLDPGAGGRVEVRREPTRLVVTWRAVPQFETPHRVTTRLVLERGGAVTFVYGPLTLEPLSGLVVRGVVPGGGAPRMTSAPLPGGGAFRIAPGAVWAEDFDLRERERVHAETVGHFWLILGAAAVVLLAFPLVYRAALVRPLERLLGGVRAVEAGRLSIEVPVGGRDEVGELTEGFNRMTHSLRRYASEMEDLVAARTAALEEKSSALERSLDDLRTAQDRLVHQQKMASLGQLTAGVAHEIKNPLNFVVNFAALNAELAGDLRAALASGDRAAAEETLADLEANAQRVHEHGRRADGIVRNMLDLARGGGGERRPFALNALVEEHVALAYHGARARRHVHV